jgi:hypothetical protein
MAFGLFFPGGVLISKYGQLSFPLQWFHAHRILEVGINQLPESCSASSRRRTS